MYARFRAGKQALNDRYIFPLSKILGVDFDKLKELNDNLRSKKEKKFTLDGNRLLRNLISGVNQGYDTIDKFLLFLKYGNGLENDINTL